MRLFFTAVLTALFCGQSRATQVLWDAAPALAPTAQAAGQWVARTSGRVNPAQSKPDGIYLRTLGPEAADRYAWDLPADFPINPQACIEMEFVLQPSDSVRQLTLYLAQGPGWRTISEANLHRGWNRLILPFFKLSHEGAVVAGPCGTARLALWPSTDKEPASLRMDRLRVILPETQIVIADGPSTPAGDRWLSNRAAAFIQEWLSEAGISHGLMSEKDLAIGIPAPTRNLILAWQPRLTPAALAEIRQLVQRGGRVLVSGSEDAQLAELLQMERQTAHETKAYGTYASLEFKGSDGKPLLIHDHNWSIHPAKPLTGSGKVLALWRDARGRTIYEPSVSTTARGTWLAFPFHAGDERRKQDFLVKTLGEASPNTWTEAARARLARAERAGQWLGIGELRTAGAKAPAGRAAALAPLLADAEKLRESGHEALRRGMASHAYSAAGRLEARLDHASALAQPAAPAKEFRGVWDHNGVGLYPGGWEETCRLLKEHGFTAVFPNLMWSGKAHYRSRQIPASKTCEQFGDQLAACATAANKHGLECHVWKVCWQLGGEDSPLMENFKKAGRLQINANGEVIPWLCPSQLVNTNWEINSIVEVAKRAGVAGIHLDYVRYPEGGGCTCPHTREAFEKYLGRAVRSWPRDVLPPGADAAMFTRFRADEISRFVGRVSATVKDINPKLKVSAAVFGRYPACVDSVAQDWGRWIREGTVDFVTPMNYTQNARQFAGWLDDQIAIEESPARIMPGIGAISTECELAPDEILQQINAVRTRKMPGYMIFRLDQVLVDRSLPYLRLVQ